MEVMMGLFDVFKKKETINSPKNVNSQQAQFQKVYSLVSNEKFGVCYNYVVRRVLNATTYQSTSTLNAEGAAILEERKIRENEKTDDIVDNIVSIEDVKKMTDGLFVENVRPEIVCKKIMAAFRQIGTQNQIKIQLIDELCKEIMKMTDTFDEAFMRCVNINEESHRTVRTMSNQAYGERTSTGLGFGILTSSIGTAALYTVMNAHEHQRQLNAQSAQINSSVNAMDRGSGEVLYNSVMELYDAYQKDMNRVLISFQAILEDKDKLQEAEEKVKQNQVRQSDMAISRNVILRAPAILSALYKAGKPCSVSELMEIEECRKYSNQSIAATARSMFERGVLGRDIKDQKMYFYPIPDSLENAMEIMGITEKTIEEAKSQVRQSDTTISPNMIPKALDILSALYKIGKPCSVSELMKIDECSRYSHQNIAATTKRMCDLGVLGKDIKDQIMFFYPIPDSLEKGMEIMGITEEAIGDVKIQLPQNNDTLLDLNYEELEVQICNCPCCNKSVSVQAVACPDCGYPVKKNFYTSLYNKEPLEQEKVTKRQYIVKMWILARYLDMPVTELPRKVNQINTWVAENAGILNRIKEDDVVALSKSPESDFGKIIGFLKHEEELHRFDRYMKDKYMPTRKNI